MTKSAADFTVGDHVVYPAHGVGQIAGVETQEVAGLSLEVYVITFDHEKMTLRVPTRKAKTAGLRSLADTAIVSLAFTTLKGRARVKRTMWSRRAQEYEAKINSGDLISIAEVVRDLHRADNQPEQSYSERQLYESALDRMAREVAAIEKIDRDAAVGLLTKSLVKAA
jgi:CarD family transcriptional regulator